MTRWVGVLVGFVAVVGLSVPRAEQPAAGGIEGLVVDPFDVGVGAAEVAIVSISGYRATSRTDSNGAVDFTNVVAGVYTLEVVRDGFEPIERMVTVPEAGRVPVRVVLTPLVAAGLSVVAVDPQGLALPGVVVEALGPGGEALTEVTGPDGAVVFAGVRPGPWRLRGTLAGFDAAEEVAVAAFGVSVPVRLSLSLDYAVAESVVVVGSRRTVGRRTPAESPVAVEIVSGAQPRADMVEVMRALSPSFNVNTQPISDAATVVRPVNFRNLAPDHLLVMVNGKRRHRGAVIAWLGNGLSDGSQGPDLSAIPTIGVRQAELLRDGAAAQYGSDAIAGVVNFELKDARSGGSVEVRSGVYGARNAGDVRTCGALAAAQPGLSCAGIGGRASGYTVAGNVGLPLGTGFANLSMEAGGQGATNRAVQRADALALVGAGGAAPRDTAQVWGQPEIGGDIKLFGNFGGTLASGHQPYLHANFARRRVVGGFYYRHPHTRSGAFRGPEVDGVQSLLVGDRLQAATGVPGAGGCPSVPVVEHRPDAAALAAVEAHPDCFTLYSRFPAGFTPQFGGVLRDHPVVAGLRSVADGGATWDVSVGAGRSDIDQFIFDTVNASLGSETPTEFSPGGYEQSELNVNADVAVPLSDRLHLAVGAEYRVERFSIVAGDEASWMIGPYAEQGFSSGSNGFNGYRPDTTAGSWGRANAALYADLELDGVESEWSVGGALRLERFEDFGNTLNGKGVFRRELGPVLAVRGSVSTGFRAPTPGQQHTFNVTTAFIDGELVNNGVVPATSGVALARGGRALAPERSRNLSAGVVVARGAFQLSADWFRIDIDDRVALTQEIRLRPDEIDTLLAEGIAEARNFPVFRFFVNDFSTVTQGADVLGSWALGAGTTLTGSWNYTVTTVADLRSNVIDAFRVQTLERGLPVSRWQLSAEHRREGWSLTGRLHWYGAYWDSEDGRNAADLGAHAVPWEYPLYPGRLLADVELGVRGPGGAWLAFGVENVAGVYPEENRFAPLTVGNRYGQFSPFGFGGAYYYARATYVVGPWRTLVVCPRNDLTVARLWPNGCWPRRFRPETSGCFVGQP